jgi:hypothetical protein
VGANSGLAAFNLSKQAVTGNIYVDSISSLELKLSDTSSFTGVINSDGTQASSLSGTIDSSSTGTLNADSYISMLNGRMDNVVTNGPTRYVNGNAKK